MGKALVLTNILKQLQKVTEDGLEMRPRGFSGEWKAAETQSEADRETDRSLGKWVAESQDNTFGRNNNF